MSSRANQAFVSRRAKQKLVEVLFGRKNPRGGPHAHRRLDPHSYTYKQLRRAYLERLQDIHPDKFAHRSTASPADTRCRGRAEADASTDDGGGGSRGPPGVDASSSSSRERHDAFVEVQDAWDEYEKLARVMQKASGGTSSAGVEHGADANFTMFGVGCSFSDSPEERDLRSEIMDQAGRGFFYSGLIAEQCIDTGEDPGTEGEGEGDGGSAERVRLCDDDLFVTQHDGESVSGFTDGNQDKQNERGHSSSASSLKRNRKSLILGGLPRKTGAQPT